jgi:quinol monooxygenase YgiN
MSQDIPSVAVLALHRVADYDTWKKTFDEHIPDSVEASCLGYHIGRGADDPSMVYVYMPATDVHKVREFFQSPRLGDAMRRARVEGAATIKLLAPKSADFIPDQKLSAIIATHAVEDYDRWRAVYDELADFRKQKGIVGDAVNQELDDPNQVIVYHQANDMDSLRAFVDSAELEEAMLRAGVIGQPDIQFVRVVDFADYRLQPQLI